jgi:diketogulonate reductase-like aldo/keto reductase
MQGYENAIKSFKNSLKEIGVKYIDLFLIHWPVVKGEEEK